MEKSIKWVLLLLAAMVIGAVIWSMTNGGHLVGAVGPTSNTTNLGVATLQVGSGCDNSQGNCLGTQLSGINKGTCVLWAPANTIAATTTQVVECQAATNGSLSALTNVTAGDQVFVTMASSTSSTFGGVVLNGATASTTAGYIDVRVANLTGTTFTWTALASSSISYLDIK